MDEKLEHVCEILGLSEQEITDKTLVKEIDIALEDFP